MENSPCFSAPSTGISDELKAEADEFIKIPMCGFVESLNVSASAAILLYMLSSRLRASVVDWNIPVEEYNEILFRWMKESVRSADDIMSRWRG